MSSTASKLYKPRVDEWEPILDDAEWQSILKNCTKGEPLTCFLNGLADSVPRARATQSIRINKSMGFGADVWRVAVPDVYHSSVISIDASDFSAKDIINHLITIKAKWTEDVKVEFYDLPKKVLETVLSVWDGKDGWDGRGAEWHDKNPELQNVAHGLMSFYLFDGKMYECPQGRDRERKNTVLFRILLAKRRERGERG
ncbi:hypothetical protein EJ06DRAFT_274471 [Trichodelitschia bisporula]|uniref:Uncharacterized protein n=1 Tax=Trichodelitschia bisporula TaxID=703511 RepID=A0A6G1I5G5_9PEZI|nr:hypothetical protein EJ06DRAFT_274471 [Trichodelitschia bisporula]